MTGGRNVDASRDLGGGVYEHRVVHASVRAGERGVGTWSQDVEDAVVSPVEATVIVKRKRLSSTWTRTDGHHTGPATSWH